MAARPMARGEAYGSEKRRRYRAVQPNEETCSTSRIRSGVISMSNVNPALDKDAVAAYLTWIRSDDGQKM